MQGTRQAPELPTLVAKVCMKGGELWLGPVPPEDRLPEIMEHNIHIQICCFEKSPTEVWVDPDDVSTRGVLIPNTMGFKLRIGEAKQRAADFKRL